MSIFNFILFILSVGSGFPRSEFDLLGAFITLPQKQQETIKQMCNEGWPARNIYLFIYLFHSHTIPIGAKLSWSTRRPRSTSTLDVLRGEQELVSLFVCTTCCSLEARAERGSDALAVPSNLTMSLLTSADSDFPLSHPTLHITVIQL